MTTFNLDNLSHPETRLIYVAEIMRALKPFMIPVFEWDANEQSLSFNGFSITKAIDGTYIAEVVVEIPATRDSPGDADVATIVRNASLNTAVCCAVSAAYDSQRDARLEMLGYIDLFGEDRPESVYQDALNFLTSSGIDISVVK